MDASSRYRPFTDKERDLALALGRCRFLPASSEKRFCLDMAAKAGTGSPVITEKQAAYLVQMAWRYRKQLDPKIRPTVQPRPMGAKPIARAG
jgi:hypothetical protein